MIFHLHWLMDMIDSSLEVDHLPVFMCVGRGRDKTRPRFF